MRAKNPQSAKAQPPKPLKKAQGSLEYLLLIGGSVVVAVIVIFIVIGLAGTAGNYTAGQTQQVLSYYEYLLTTPEEELWNVVCFSANEVNYELEITSNVTGPPSGVALSAGTMNALLTAAGLSGEVENGVVCQIDPGAGEGISGGFKSINVVNGALQPLLIPGGGISCDGLRFGAANEISITFADADPASTKKFAIIYGSKSEVNPNSFAISRDGAPFPSSIALPEEVLTACLVWYGPIQAAPEPSPQ